MKIEMTTVEWRHVLEWTKSIVQTELDSANTPALAPGPKEAKQYHRRARTWRRLSTKIKEGLKRGPKADKT